MSQRKSHESNVWMCNVLQGTYVIVVASCASCLFVSFLPVDIVNIIVQWTKDTLFFLIKCKIKNCLKDHFVGTGGIGDETCRLLQNTNKYIIQPLPVTLWWQSLSWHCIWGVELNSAEIYLYSFTHIHSCDQRKETRVFLINCIW